MIFISGWITSVSHVRGQRGQYLPSLNQTKRLWLLMPCKQKCLDNASEESSRILCGKCTREQGQTRDDHF